MKGPASAFAALGLEPGADRAAVEQAYRRLIKQHHPDRSGGDSDRAAEINRAYAELRSAPGEEEFPRAPPRQRRRRRPAKRRSVLPTLAVLVGAAALLAQGERLPDALEEWSVAIERSWSQTVAAGPARLRQAVSFDAPLHDGPIAASVEQAVRLAADADFDGLAAHSRACHRRLRAAPELAQLDRCAAFDNAAAVLDSNDPLRGSGPFSASAVTARQLTGARLLSSDYLAIDARLNRVRGRVEMILKPEAERAPSAD